MDTDDGDCNRNTVFYIYLLYEAYLRAKRNARRRAFLRFNKVII